MIWDKKKDESSCRRVLVPCTPAIAAVCTVEFRGRRGRAWGTWGAERGTSPMRGGSDTALRFVVVGTFFYLQSKEFVRSSDLCRV